MRRPVLKAVKFLSLRKTFHARDEMLDWGDDSVSTFEMYFPC